MEQEIPDPSEMSATQRKLLKRLLDRKLKPTSDATDIPRAAADRDVPLTAAQAGVWFLARMFPESAEYNQAGTLRFRRCPDPQAFDRAVKFLMERHDALRLRVYDIDGDPVQELCDGLEAPITWHDLRGDPVSEAKSRTVEICGRCLQEPFELERAPLFRVAVVRLPDGAAVAILVFHHVVVDGRSLEMLYDELSALLAGRSLAPTPPIRFIDFAAWRHSRRADESLEAQLAYWREKLSGDLPVLDLPSDRPRPARPSRRGHTVPCRVPLEVTDALRRLSEVENTTLYVVLLSVYKVFLMRMTGLTDVLVGAPFSGRDHSAIEDLVGMFVNSAALRTDLGGNPSFRALLRRVRATVLEAQDNREVPFDRVVAELNVRRDLQHSPLFQTMFGLGGLPRDLSEGIKINELIIDSEAAKWDLTTFLDELDGRIDGFMEYSADLFDRSTAVRFVETYLRLCSAFATSPDMAILQAPLLSDSDKRHIVHGLNPYVRPDHPYTTMAQPFEEQVRRSPNAIALSGFEGQRSYAELNADANRLAHGLRAIGVGPGSFVAVCMERCFDLIIALLAVAKSGAAYVPLDPDLPSERIGFMLDDTDPELVLAHEPTRNRVATGARPLLLVDADRAQWGERPIQDLACTAPPHRPVHLLYTSGSTGRPKAVVYPVNGAIAEIFWLHRSYPLQEGGANIFITSYGFDVSIWEIFWSLYFGARLIVPKPGEHRDPERLIEWIDAHGVTTVFLIPGMLDILLDALPRGACSTLRWVFSGGAPISPRLRDRFYERFPTKLLLNCFGPTEAGCVTDMVLPRDPGNPRVPLGRPAANFRLYVLDSEFEPCPIGVPGEACLAGEIGIALGYHGRPGLTAERFLPDPFGEPGGRMYRTGDLCRYRGDGVLEHLGRIDRQVKVRGMRIEPAEIEAVICEHEAVAQCHVFVHNDPKIGQRLPAFVVLVDGYEVEPRVLMDHARRFLPQHMIPAAIVLVDRLPTNVNNKIDSAALAAIGWAAEVEDERQIVAPDEGSDEEAMMTIFREQLGIDAFSVTDSFFDLGGHSLLVFKLIAACESAFGYRPSVADVFTCPTVRGLCTRLHSSDRSPRACLVPLAPQPGKPLVVFIHGAGGSVLPFAEIARALGPNLSCWGLQAPDWDDPSAPTTICGLAAAYGREVDAIREMSPVVLVGWSMGGCIAFEMVRDWRAHGVDVAAALLLDTWTPPPVLRAEDRVHALSIVHGADVLGHEGIASEEFADGVDALTEMKRVIERNLQAFTQYRPQALDLDLDYLRALEHFPDPSIDFPDSMEVPPDRGWGAFARSVAVHSVAGDHYSMVNRQHALGLATTIGAIVDERLSHGEI